MVPQQPPSGPQGLLRLVVLVVVAIAGVVTLALDTGFITLLKLAIGA